MLKKGLIILLLTIITVSEITYIVYKNTKKTTDVSLANKTTDNLKKIVEEINKNDLVIKKETDKKNNIEKQNLSERNIKPKKHKTQENKTTNFSKKSKQIISKKKKTQVKSKETLKKKQEIISIKKIAKTEEIKKDKRTENKTIIKNKIEKENKPVIEKTEPSKKVDQTQLIKIMIELNEFDSAEKMLKEIKNKNSYDYYFLSAKLAESQNQFDGAIALYKKAFNKDMVNPIPRFRILGIYIKNTKYKRKIKKELKLISTLKMTEKEKEEFKILKSLLNKDENIKNFFRVTAGTAATDNVGNDYTDKTSDIKSIFSLTYLNLMKINDKFSLSSFVSYYNETYAATEEKNSHSFFAGTEISRTFSKWKISVPLMLNYSLINNEEAVQSETLGIEGTKTINDNFKVSLGTNITPTENKLYDYNGAKYSIYSNIDWHKSASTDYGLKLNIVQTNYSEESENYLALGAEFIRKKLYNKKHLLTFTYDIVFEKYNQDNREDLIHSLSLDFKSNLFNTEWKYILAYDFELDDSNYTENEYSKNEITFKLRKDF